MTNQKTILVTKLIEQLKQDVAPDRKLDDDKVRESIRKVHQIYITKGRSDSVAKAKYFTEAVVEDAMKMEPNLD